MFDRIMENSMALWMLLSALFPVVFFGTIIKAILHYRRTRSLARYREYLSSIPRLASFRTNEDRVETEDWIPSR
ncbi:MAG: hypothetical protein ABIW76_16375 [Fibrobacteria bacterium]